MPFFQEMIPYHMIEGRYGPINRAIDINMQNWLLLRNGPQMEG